MSGKTIAAAIALFTTPIVARLFDPSDFGVVAVFVSVVSIVSNVSSLRYEMAVSLPKEEREARLLIALAYRAMIGMSLLVLLFVAVTTFTDTRFGPFSILGQWSWLLPLGIFLTGVLHVQESWLTRRTRFKLSSVSLVVGNATTSSSRIAFGALAGSSVYGLILSYLLGITSRLVVQRASTREAFHGESFKADWKSIFRTAREWSDFPRLNAPAGLIFALGGNLPVLLFGTMFSPAVAGLYAMANRLTRAPMAIVASSVRRVFLQKAAAIRNRGGNLRKAYVLTTGTLAVLGLLPLFVIMSFGQPVLGWLLGERWLEAGRYVEVVAPWMFMLWVTAPANPVFVVLRKQKFWLFLQTWITLLRLGAFGIAFAVGAAAEQTLQLFVGATVLGNLVTISVAYTLISRHAADPVAGEPRQSVT